MSGRVVVLLCVVALFAAACSDKGEVGVRKTADGFEVLSRCSDVGVAGFAAGSDVGSREQGIFPILESVDLDVQLVDGVDGDDVPHSLSAADPGELYEVTGSMSALDLSSPLVIDAEVAQALRYTSAMVVDLSTMEIGDIALPDHTPDATERQVIVGDDQFEAGRYACKDWDPPLWVRRVVAAIALALVGGAGIWGFARRRQRRRLA